MFGVNRPKKSGTAIYLNIILQESPALDMNAEVLEIWSN
jgi:hypothetical protein